MSIHLTPSRRPLSLEMRRGIVRHREPAKGGPSLMQTLVLVMRRLPSVGRRYVRFVAATDLQLCDKTKDRTHHAHPGNWARKSRRFGYWPGGAEARSRSE